MQATQQMNALFPGLKEPVEEAVMVDAAAVLPKSVLPPSGAWGAMEASRCGPRAPAERLLTSDLWRRPCGTHPHISRSVNVGNIAAELYGQFVTARYCRLGSDQHGLHAPAALSVKGCIGQQCWVVSMNCWGRAFEN